jgi:hypothetical protein
MTFPPTTIDVRDLEHIIDKTPDGYYAIRILKCFMERDTCKFFLEGDFADGERALYQRMNDDCDKRVKELDVAIQVLEEYKNNLDAYECDKRCGDGDLSRYQ